MDNAKFGQFLTTMAERSEKADTATVKAIQDKIKAEQQARIESAVMQVYKRIEVYVQTIREYRKQESRLIAQIKEQEKVAIEILNGTFREDSESLGSLLRQKTTRF